MAAITLVSSSATTLTICVSDYPSNSCYIRYYLGTSEEDMPWIGYSDVNGLPSVTYTITELEPNTTYAVKILPVDESNTNGGRTEDPTTEWFKTKGERPEDWEWESNVASGDSVTVVQLSDGTLCVVYLTAQEWNNFIDRIYEFTNYLDKSTFDVDSYYVTSGSGMMASEANAAIDLIDSLNPPTATPSPVFSGETITATFINDLKDSLNSIQ